MYNQKEVKGKSFWLAHGPCHTCTVLSRPAKTMSLLSGDQASTFTWLSYNSFRGYPSRLGEGRKRKPRRGIPEMRSGIQVASKKMRPISAQMYGALRQSYGA